MWRRYKDGGGELLYHILVGYRLFVCLLEAKTAVSIFVPPTCNAFARYMAVGIRLTRGIGGRRVGTLSRRVYTWRSAVSITRRVTPLSYQLDEQTRQAKRSLSVRQPSAVR